MTLVPRLYYLISCLLNNLTLWSISPNGTKLTYFVPLPPIIVSEGMMFFRLYVHHIHSSVHLSRHTRLEQFREKLARNIH